MAVVGNRAFTAFAAAEGRRGGRVRHGHAARSCGARRSGPTHAGTTGRTTARSPRRPPTTRARVRPRSPRPAGGPGREDGRRPLVARPRQGRRAPSRRSTAGPRRPSSPASAWSSSTRSRRSRASPASTASTGRVRWTAGKNEVSYQSPVLATLAGQRQLVVADEKRSPASIPPRARSCGSTTRRRTARPSPRAARSAGRSRGTGSSSRRARTTLGAVPGEEGRDGLEDDDAVDQQGLPHHVQPGRCTTRGTSTVTRASFLACVDAATGETTLALPRARRRLPGPGGRAPGGADQERQPARGRGQPRGLQGAGPAPGLPRRPLLDGAERGGRALVRPRHVEGGRGERGGRGRRAAAAPPAVGPAAGSAARPLPGGCGRAADKTGGRGRVPGQRAVVPAHRGRRRGVPLPGPGQRPGDRQRPASARGSSCP